MLPLPLRNPKYGSKIDAYFGEARSYGLHDGVDYNLVSGGNTDCGELMYPIARCRVVHWSESSTSFGNIVVIEISGEWGTHWVRYCHCQEILVKDGPCEVDTPIAKMGTTGNSTACHLHLSIFKKKPTNWRMIASNVTSLNEWFVDPVPFIENNNAIITPPMDVKSKLLEDYRSNDPDYSFGGGIKTEGDVRAVIDKLNEHSVLKQDHKNLKKSLDDKDKELLGWIRRQVATLVLPNKDGNADYTLDEIAAQIVKLIHTEDERDRLMELWNKLVGPRDNFANQVVNIENWIDDYSKSRPLLLERVNQQKLQIETLETKLIEKEKEIEALRKKKPTRVLRLGSWLLWMIKIES